MHRTPGNGPFIAVHLVWRTRGKTFCREEHSDGEGRDDGATVSVPQQHVACVGRIPLWSGAPLVP